MTATADPLPTLGELEEQVLVVREIALDVIAGSRAPDDLYGELPPDLVVGLCDAARQLVAVTAERDLLRNLSGDQDRRAVIAEAANLRGRLAAAQAERDAMREQRDDADGRCFDWMEQNNELKRCLRDTEDGHDELTAELRADLAAAREALREALDDIKAQGRAPLVPWARWSALAAKGGGDAGSV